MEKHVLNSTASHASLLALKRGWKAVNDATKRVLTEPIVTLALSATLAFSGCSGDAARFNTDGGASGQGDAQGQIADGGNKKKDAGSTNLDASNDSQNAGPCKDPNEKEWVAVYNEGIDSYSYDVATDLNGNVYAIGTTFQSIPPYEYVSDIWIRKLNPDGNELWKITVNGIPSDDSWDEGIGITTDKNGNVYATGHIEINKDRYAWIRKMDSDGNTIWETTYNSPNSTDIWDDGGCRVVVDDNGNVYVTGIVLVLRSTKGDIWVSKFDSEGNMLWQKTYDGPGDVITWDRGFDIAIDNIGNITVVGHEEFDELGVNENVWVRKFNPDGDIIWTRTYPYGVGMGIDIDNDNQIYLAGYLIEGDVAGGDFFYDLWVNKLDANGDDLWPVPIIGTGSEFGSDAFGVVVDAARNIYITGSDMPNESTSNIRTQKMSSDLEEIWVRIYGDRNNLHDMAYAVALSPDEKSVYVAGAEGDRADGFSTYYKAVVIKLCNPD